MVKKQAGQEHGYTHHAGGDIAEILPYRVDGGHTSDDGQPVGDHHEGDAHEDDRDDEPDQGVAVVGAQHGGGGDGAGADDDAGGDQARADTLEQVF